MVDMEILQAMSEMFDKKLEPIYKKLDTLEEEIVIIKLDIENVVKPNINLLIDNFLPAAKNFDNVSNDISKIKADVELHNRVITEHSVAIEELQRIS